MAQKIGEWRTNLPKFSTFIWRNSAVSKLVKVNDEFLAKHCAPVTFCLTNKVW